MPVSQKLDAGSDAPDFALQDEVGNIRKLADITARGCGMLVFYPGDFRMVCTKQLCAYQESYGFFRDKGLEVAGISHNTPEEHLKFKQTYGFSFPLLSDPNRETIKKYGMTSLLMLGGTSRSVFLVHRTGKILYRYVEPIALSHRRPEELKEVVEKLHNLKLL